MMKGNIADDARNQELDESDASPYVRFDIGHAQ